MISKSETKRAYRVEVKVSTELGYAGDGLKLNDSFIFNVEAINKKACSDFVDRNILFGFHNHIKVESVTITSGNKP